MPLHHLIGHMTRAEKSLAEQMEKSNDFIKNLPMLSKKEATETTILHLSLLMKKIERAEDRLAKLVTEAEKEKSDEEVEEKTEERTDKVTKLIDEAYGVYDNLEANKCLLENDQENPTPAQVVQVQPLPRIDRTSTLPKITIPKFKGNSWEFPNFWILFQEIVGKTNESPLIKLNHLINSLEGEPNNLLKKFRITSENYEPAIQLLKQRYDNTETTIVDLTDRLMKEKSKGSKIGDQRQLLDSINIIIEQLKLNSEEVNTRMMKEVVISKFNDAIKKDVFRKKIELKKDNLWTMQKILEDLEETISRDEEIEKLMKVETKEDAPKEEKKTSGNTQKDKQSNGSNNGSNKGSNKVSKSDPKCKFCNEAHRSEECTKVVDLKARISSIREQERCENCLGQKHNASECRSKFSCKHCKQRHHSSLCSKSVGTNAPTNGQTKEKVNTAKPNQPNRNVNHSSIEYQDEEQHVMLSSAKKKAYLPTVRAMVRDPENDIWRSLSILIDSGADQSYISEEMAKMLNLPTLGKISLRLRTFGQSEPETQLFDQSEVELKMENRTIKLKMLKSKHLTGWIRKAEMSPEDKLFAEVNQLQLNEDVWQDQIKPSIIIGCDYLTTIWNGENLVLPSGLQLIKTKLGFTSLGMNKSEMAKSTITSFEDHAEINMAIGDETIEMEQMKDTSMKTENEYTGPLAEEQKAIDAKTMEFFNNTIERRHDGYYVRIPFKDDHQTLPSNYAIALRRLENVVKNTPKEVLMRMDDIFKEQLTKGIIEVVNPNEKPKGLIHYNPSQPVLTPNKTTTKLRIVVDASSHFKDEKSLNDVIHQGPTILPDITHLLARFRSGKNVLLSDVEKAFHTIRLHEDDRDVTRILWIKDINQPVTKYNIVIFRHRRVLFGLNVSPFLLAATIQYHLQNNHNKEFVSDIVENIYVDNLIITFDENKDKGVQLYRQVKQTFEEMNMNLREFMSNNIEIMDQIDEADKSQEENVKILGLPWNTKSDQITLRIEEESLSNRNSRRSVSSKIARTFDPMGNLVPIMLPLKLFQRKLWNAEYKWDTPLSEEHEFELHQIIAGLENFEIKIQREIISKSKPNTIIVFSDASKEAAAYAIYVKSELGTRLLFAKSKVRPIKEAWTIPKMEAQSLSMATTKTNTLVQALIRGNIKIDDVIFFCDSEIVLSWLRGQPGRKEVGTFVTNRLRTMKTAITEIEKQQVKVQFGYVRSKENPADLGTRGVDKHSFEKTIWWEGPTFIQESVEKWNAKLFEIKDEEGIINLNTSHETVEEEIFNCERSSSFSKMKRIVAYAMRFIRRTLKNLPKATKERFECTISELKSVTDKEHISVQEMKAAESLLIRQHQMTISESKKTKLKDLKLQVDQNGVIVCRGRLEKSDMPETGKYPILIADKSELAKLIIIEAHGKWHSSVAHTMANVRTKYWIPKLRQQVKHHIAQCVRCQRFNRQPMKYPNMGNLPKSRVFQSRPFETVGIDYFGPIGYKTENDDLAEAYGVILTCATTRMIHLEVVTSMDTSSFLKAFRRFIAIRGTPREIISDNAPQFLLANKILQNAQTKTSLNNEIIEFLGVKEITWNHIVPYSPWQGGFYERLVKSVKHSFMKGIGRKVLKLDELDTTFQEIAASLNGRPLTYMEEGPETVKIIRPIDFLQNGISITIPSNELEEITDEYRPSLETKAMRTQIETLQELKSSIKSTEEVWEIWKTKYLSELREKHKFRMDEKRGPIKVPSTGDVVLLCDPDQPRNYWKLAKIIEVITSKDGVTREVQVRKSNGRTTKRPINLIVPLEIKSNVADSDHTVEENNESPQHSTYNLRQRQPINYNEDDSFVNYSRTMNTRPWSVSFASLRTAPLLLTFLLALSQIPMSHQNSSEESVECTNFGLRLFGKIENFEICTNSYCTNWKRMKWNREEGIDVWLPPAVKIREHVCIVKLFKESVEIVTKTCPAVNACETIDCTICFANIFNPECHPQYAIIGLCIILYGSLLLLYCIFNIPLRIGEPLIIAWKIFIHIGKLCRICQIIATTISRCFTRRSNRRKWRDLITIVAILIANVNACQETDIIHNSETVCSNDIQTQQCQVITQHFVNLNNIQKESCIRMIKNGTAVKEVRLEFENMELKCLKKSIVFTREITQKVWVTKRCAHMGSCSESKCMPIRRNSEIPELAHVQNFTGSVFCMESCGGLNCGCFYPSAACTFFKIFSEVKTPDIFELFECEEWIPTINIKITIRNLLTRSTSSEILNLKLNQPHIYQGNIIKLDAMSNPRSTILSSRFMSRNVSIITWDTSELPEFRCKSREDAVKVKCELFEKCDCQPTEQEVKCECSDTVLETQFNRIERRLPLSIGHWTLMTNGDFLMAKIQEGVSAEIGIKLANNKTELILVKDTDICRIEKSPIEGCYKCTEAATAKIRCFSKKKQIMATISCQNDMFTVDCSPNGTFNSLTLFEQTAKIEKKCEVECGSTRTKFEITGTLKYTGSVWTSLNRIIQGGSTIYGEINFPDTSHILDCYFGYMKELLMVIIGIGILILIIYAILAKSATTIFTTIIRVSIRIVLLPFKIAARIFRLLREPRTRPTHIELKTHTM